MDIIIPGIILVFLLVIMAFVMALNAETNEKFCLWRIGDGFVFSDDAKKSSKKEGEPAERRKNDDCQMEQVFSNFLYLKKPRMFQDLPVALLKLLLK